MRSYKRAALLGGFISACKGGAASLPGTLRAESEAFGAALEAERGGGANSAEEAFARTYDDLGDDQFTLVLENTDDGAMPYSSRSRAADEVQKLGADGSLKTMA